MKKCLYKALWLALAFVSVSALPSCSEDEEVIPQETFGFESMPESRDIPCSYEMDTQSVSFTALGKWHVELEDGVDWVYFAPSAGNKGKNTLDVKVAQNYSSEGRSATFHIVSGEEKEMFTVRQPEFGGTLPDIVPGENPNIDPATIPDYDKFFPNSEYGAGILKTSSRFSFARYKSSEHFFVFWAPEFGEDPNAPTVPANMRVDIDDLLLKAEKYFDTNINKLGMADLEQGKSMLDKYKMQIYLLYQEEWLATGSGYDDMIGALWINPSTCQPVGSTIAHEIGHSFQFQTYADRVQAQGVPNDYKSGFRYGFSGPDGAYGGGCVYWEQCAQWQAHQDYPGEMFTTADYPVWLKNNHRHFHHEFMRYASYWLQSYWVQKHGVESYGRIWKESVAPEDAIMAYTRLYNGNDYGKTREELFDYAMRMATYDIDGVREYVGDNQDRYRTNLFFNSPTGEYQVSYSNCPGATGFNVISLTVPENGGKVTVDFRGLDYGATLATKDRGTIVNADGQSKGSTTKYNAVGGAENMGWRYGFVALSGDKRTYGTVGKAATGKLSFDVPAGTEYLFLVVQGSPEIYMSHAWDDSEVNDPQFPYAFKLEGTSLKYYEDPLEASYEEKDGVLNATLNVSVDSANADWAFGTYDIAEKAVCDYFGLTASEMSSAMIVPTNATVQKAEEGKIIVLNENADGSLADTPTANYGYWLDMNGNAVAWGSGHAVYYEISGTTITLGKLGADSGNPGDVMTMRPVFVYTKDGKTKTLKFKINYRFK